MSFTCQPLYSRGKNIPLPIELQAILALQPVMKFFGETKFLAPVKNRNPYRAACLNTTLAALAPSAFEVD
jgi:hypothetical protein